MGPASATHTLPSRPKFSWDSKSPPWTDGKGDQEEYRDAVKLWQTFHKALPVNNNNKIPNELQAICLKSQLYGCAKDLCSGITDEQLVGERAVDLLVGQIYKRDALSVVSEAYKAFNQLSNTRLGALENMKNFESRFSAQVAKFNAISTTTKLPDCITALMLISNSSIDDVQRVSVMAASAPSAASLSAESTNDQFLSAVTYNAVASVIKQCDKSRPSTSENNESTMSASSGGLSHQGSKNRRNGNRDRSGTSPTMKYPCNTCGKYGHWNQNHRADGSLASGVKSFDHPLNSTNSTNSNGNASSSVSGSGLASAETDKKGILSFNNANLDRSLQESTLLGPLVDSGAPYSAIGLFELNVLADHLGLSHSPTLNAIPKSLGEFKSWQYGVGTHANPARKILGSIVLNAITDNSNTVRTTHLVLDGSSQWVIGRNVTSRTNIEHIGRNALVFPFHGEEDLISLVERRFLSLTELLRFRPLTHSKSGLSVNSGSTLSCLSAVSVNHSSWPRVRHVLDKVHKHVCVHAAFSDYKVFLERNGLWNDIVAKFLSDVVSACNACHSTSLRKPSRKVSISSVLKEFNEILCVDHLVFERLCVFQCMDLVSRFSAAHVVRTTFLKEAVIGFESCWNSQFWYPDSFLADKAFTSGDFQSYADSLGIPIKLVPKQRHHKNPIESKHNIIRSVFLRLKESAGDDYIPEAAAYQAVTISNDLYGNDVMSAFELAKGFTKPINAKPADTASVFWECQFDLLVC